MSTTTLRNFNENLTHINLLWKIQFCNVTQKLTHFLQNKTMLKTFCCCVTTQTRYGHASVV